MRELLRGHEQTLAKAGGLIVPVVMVLVFFAAPVIGAETAYGLLKFAATGFAVMSVLWYLADDTVTRQDEYADEGDGESESESESADAAKDDIDAEEPRDYFPPVKVEAATALGTGEKSSASDNFAGQRSSDKLRIFPGLTEEDVPEEPPPQTYVFRGTTGGREGLRDRGFPKESHIPKEAKLMRMYDGWAIYHSASEKALFVKTTDYHPKPLRVTEEMLADLLDELKSESQSP